MNGVFQMAGNGNSTGPVLLVIGLLFVLVAVLWEFFPLSF
jgi:hypothetical protein